MAKYAEKTTVSSDKSRAEIERTLIKYGATGFAYGWEAGVAVVGFSANERHIRFTLPMPDKSAKEFTHTEARATRRSHEQIEAVYEQAIRQRWRALALAVKAKLEAVSAGITTFEQEFMAHIVLPNGNTVGQWMRPQINEAYKSGKMPPLLLGCSRESER